MGLLLALIACVSTLPLAICMLLLLGALGGFIVVPMNALLQHRGHNLMGAGRSIAVQNFNEQACILLLGLVYATSVRKGMGALEAVIAFGLLVAGLMALILCWYLRTLRLHRKEVARLLVIARSDKSH